MTVNSIDTSLLAGKVLVSFTANTTKNNSVAFTMSTLTPGKRYFVNVGGTLANTKYADIDGVIRFNRSIWPAGAFTVVEDVVATPQPGPVSGDLNGDRVVDENDVDIVRQHMGNKTTPPYPNYDFNQDGIVDVLDMEYITGKIPLSIIDRVLAFLNSLF
jgi:hypothetical protein